MERVIKFRAWDKRKKQWVSVGFHIFGETTLFRLNESYCLENRENGEGSLERMNDIEVTQFTGLTDKNGKDIYEGDILKLIDEYRGKGERPVYVIWENLQWMMQGTMHYSHKDFIGNYCIDKMEVIGNLYENEKLLSHE